MGNNFVQIGGEWFSRVSHEGQDSFRVSLAHHPTYHVNLSVSNASGTVGYMLIDLSDTTNWPHSDTGHIILEQVIIDTNTNATFAGDLSFGFLSSVDATNGDYHQIGFLHGERSSTVGQGAFNFSNYGFDLETENWFGPTVSNDTTWQTDVNLIGPDGGTSYPSGNGDFVMKLISSAGAVDLSVTVTYTTVP